MTGWDETLLSAYLDGELQGDRAREVERLLAADPAARRELARLAYVAGLVRAAARQGLAEPPSPLVDAIARHGRVQPTRRQLVGWALAASAAAAALVGAGAYVGFFYGRGDAERRVAGTVAANEVDRWLDDVAAYVRLYADDERHLVEVGADRRGYIERWLGERLQRPLKVPDLDGDGLTFRGARLIAAAGRPAAQLVYMRPDGKPLGLCITRTTRADQPPEATRRGDLNMLYWSRSGSAYVLVGWADDQALRTVWASARPQLGDPIAR